MAILRGFPPSNTISTCQPSKFNCELCGKEFWQSFPLSLYLSIGDKKYSILPCRECFEEDQGKTYWSGELNKWGDHFRIYSKAREGYSYWEILWKHVYYPALDASRKLGEAITWDRTTTLSESTSKQAESLYIKIKSSLESYWNAWNDGWKTKTYKPSIEYVPSKLFLTTNEDMFEIFKFFYKAEERSNHIYISWPNDRFEWYVRKDPMIPNYPCSTLFIEEYEDSLTK